MTNSELVVATNKLEGVNISIGETNANSQRIDLQHTPTSDNRFSSLLVLEHEIVVETYETPFIIVELNKKVMKVIKNLTRRKAILLGVGVAPSREVACRTS